MWIMDYLMPLFGLPKATLWHLHHSEEGDATLPLISFISISYGKTSKNAEYENKPKFENTKLSMAEMDIFMDKWKQRNRCVYFECLK